MTVIYDVERRDSQPFKTSKLEKSEYPLEVRIGKSCFDTRQHLLRLHLVQSRQILDHDIDKSLLIGRLCMDDGHSLDLLDFGAQRYGVSRRHAIIIKHNLTLMVQDLRSSNGTYLNGERLMPHQAVVLRDGDLLQFGRLQMRVEFAERWQ